MRNTCRLFITLSGLAALVIGGPSTGWADHVWGNYHWATTTTPLPLTAVDSVSPEWQLELDAALGEWSSLSGPLRVSVGSTDDSDRTRKQCRMQAGHMRVCNAWYGFNGWLGLATIGIDSNGHIDQGTSKMNDSYSFYWEDPNQKRHVMCQEIGHLFGLGHTSEDGSSQKTCMDYSSDPNSMSPNQHDYDTLNGMYSHADSYNSYDAGSSGGGDSGGDKPCNPKKPGCSGFDLPQGVPGGAVLMHRGQHEETWVKGRSDGGLWIFHVRLAPGGPGKH